MDSTKHGVRLDCLDGGLACNSANAHRLLHILGEDMNGSAVDDWGVLPGKDDGPLAMTAGEAVKKAVLMKVFYRYFELGQAPTVENLKGAVEEALVDFPDRASAVRAALKKWESDPLYRKDQVQKLLYAAPPKVLGKGVPYAVAGNADNWIHVDVSTETTNDEIVQNLVDIASQAK